MSCFQNPSAALLFFCGSLIIASTRLSANELPAGTPNQPDNTANQLDLPTPVRILSTAVLSGEALFKSNVDTLTDQGVQALDKLLRDLLTYEEIVSIKVTGHSDSIGAEDYNWILSESRARYIAAIISLAFPDAEIIASGKGERMPLVSNSTREGRSRNRRVEIQVIAKGRRP